MTSPLTDGPIRTVETNGIRLAYRRCGAGPPLVLIMGLGADGTAWEEHVGAWAARFSCFAVDNRGAGASDKPPGPYDTAMMADDYAGFIDGLGLRPVSVVGISMGGAIAQELAIRHPKLISRLVLVSTWARCQPYTAEIFHSLVAVRDAVPAATFAQLLQLWIWTPAFVRDHPERLTAERAAAGDSPMPQAAFAAQAAACIEHDAYDRLESITVPTLVTVGSDDLFTPRHYSTEIVERIKDATLRVFSGSGHAHHWEVVDEFNRLILEWL